MDRNRETTDERDPLDTSYFSLIPQEWLHDSSYNAVVVRCYASAVAGDPVLSEYAKTVLSCFQAIIPGKGGAIFARTGKDAPVLSTEIRPAFREGQIILSVNQKSLVVLAGGYLFLLFPLSVGEKCTDESLLTRRTDYIRGLLTAFLGHMAMFQLVFEHRYDLDNPGTVTYASPGFENHIPPADWLAFSKDTLLNNRESIVGGENEFKDRLELSLSFIGRAANELDDVVRFSHAWIALEIASGGHAAAKNFLNSLDGFAHVAKRFVDIRNGLFHHGRRPQFGQLDERLLHACVLARNLQNFGIEDSGFAALVTHYLTQYPAP